MAFGGTKGSMRFDVAQTIPVSAVQQLIQGDSRYSRGFEANEGIIIRAPLLSGFLPERDGVYYGFAVSYNENVNWSSPIPQIQNLPSQITQRDHNPDSWFLNDNYGISQLPSHSFTEEAEGKVTITLYEHGQMPTSPAAIIPSVRSEGFLGSTPASTFYSTNVPYLWGSVIEGVKSGARRFIVGPMVGGVSNPSLANETEIGSYFDLAESGTGPYGANQLKFVMPDSDQSESGSVRKNLFSYFSGSQLNLSSPINSEFLQDSPFDPSRLDYSGFRLYPRKNLPIPYNVPDKETVDSFYNGPSVDPEKTVFGTSGNQATPAWRYVGAFTTDPTRRQAFAITKRHVLGFSAPQHAYPFARGNVLEPDFYGFARGVSGKTPFTDSAEYGQGDKIQFWDKNSGRVIERTIIDTKVIDVESFREAINSIVSGAIPSLESSWNCQLVQDPVYGLIEECNVNEDGYGIDLAFGNFTRASIDRRPQGGSVCTSFAPQTIPWKGIRQNIVDEGGDEETNRLKYAKAHSFVRNNRNAFNYFNFNQSFFGASGGFDFLPRYLHSNPISGVGITSFASGKTGFYYPNPILVVDNFRGGTSGRPVTLTGGNTPSLTVNSLLPESTVVNETLYAVSKEKSIIDDSFGGVAFSERLSAVQGIASFPTERVTPNTTEPITDPIDDDPVPFGVYPPKDIDGTVPEAKVKDQFDYLPTAARNAIKQYFPHGLNNIFYGSFSENDLFTKYITWHYLISHFKPLLSANCSVHLLNEDLPDGVTPISFLDVRRSRLHKYEVHFDDQMQGHLSQNCPKRSYFAPYWAFGNPTVAADGWGGFAIGSRAVAYSNPYGSQPITFELTKVGRCQDTYNENFLQSCGEAAGMTSGPNCRWNVWSISVGSGGEVWAGPSVPPDIDVNDGCYRCWHESFGDPLATKKPTGTEDGDRLLTPLKTDGYFRGGDVPSPLFTYNADGVPIMSRVLIGSGYRSNYSQFNYLYEYSVTGVNESPYPWEDGGGFLKTNSFLYQNHDGSTGADGMRNGYAEMRVHRYSPDSGRLTLGLKILDPNTSNLIYSNDHLVNCNSNVCGSTPNVEPCQSGGWIISPTSECNSATKTFPHTLGMTAYIHNGSGGSWASVTKGGPRCLGSGAGFCLWTYGYHFNMVIGGAEAKYDDCSYPSQEDIQKSLYHEDMETMDKPLGSAWQQYLATHNMGTFLSDQKIYYRKSNPNDLNPYYYFGKVRDIFDRILDGLSLKNGITGQYRPTTKVVTFDPNLSDLVQPMASESLPPSGSFSIVRRVNKAPGIYSDEKEFLK